MPNFTVTTEVLRTQAKNLENEAADYESASKTAKSAADTLAAGWKGASQRAFVAEQEKAYAWYTEMTALARQYSAALTVAANAYDEADRRAASEMGT